MEAKVLERRENPLLSRDEVLLEVASDATPSRQSVRELVAAKLGASPETIVVKKIGGKAGSRKFLVEVYVYRDTNTLRIVEPDYVLRRNGVIEDGEAQPQ